MLNFIVNKTSSSGNAAKIWEKVSHELAVRDISYNAFITDGPGSATEHADKICKMDPEPRIVVIGGDGTVNETISGITDLTKVTFGYIPAGSSNDLARDINLTLDPIEALNAILNPPEYIMLDIGKVDNGESEKSFAVSCGMGYDASICHEALHSNIKDTLNKLHLGKLTYVMIALKQLAKAPKQKISITLDDKETVTFDKYLFAAVMNHRFEGGGFMFCPDAEYDDGILDICVVNNISKLKVLRILPSAYKGGHVKYKGVTVLRAKKIVMKSSNPACIHADGESAGICSGMTVTLREGQLKMIYKAAGRNSGRKNNE